MSLKLREKIQSQIPPCLTQASGKVNSVVLRATEKGFVWSSCWTPMFSGACGHL